MSEEALKAEIERLVRELQETRADLRAERGLQDAGEICVTRAGTYSTDPTTFNVRLSIDTVRAAREGQHYVDEMLVRLGTEIEREMRRRACIH
jgi:hypothetical protein